MKISCLSDDPSSLCYDSVELRIGQRSYGREVLAGSENQEKGAMREFSTRGASGPTTAGTRRGGGGDVTSGFSARSQIRTAAARCALIFYFRLVLFSRRDRGLIRDTKSGKRRAKDGGRRGLCARAPLTEIKDSNFRALSREPLTHSVEKINTPGFVIDPRRCGGPITRKTLLRSLPISSVSFRLRQNCRPGCSGNEISPSRHGRKRERLGNYAERFRKEECLVKKKKRRI